LEDDISKCIKFSKSTPTAAGATASASGTVPAAGAVLPKHEGRKAHAASLKQKLKRSSDAFCTNPSPA